MTRKARRTPDAPTLPARPDRGDAENAVRTLIRWAGDDPDREGLLDTPARVVRSYEEFFAGYLEDPVQILSRTFSEVDGYDKMIVMTDIHFESHHGTNSGTSAGRHSQLFTWQFGWRVVDHACECHATSAYII